MPTLRHLLPIIALLLLLLLHPALHAETHNQQHPVITRIHLHHLIEYRTTLPSASSAVHTAIHHHFTFPNPTPTTPQPQPNSFALFLHSLLSFSSRP